MLLLDGHKKTSSTFYKIPGSFVERVLIFGLNIRKSRESSRKQNENVKSEESQSLNSS